MSSLVKIKERLTRSSVTQSFSRTDRLLRHRRLCAVGIPKEENQPCCEGRSYSQDPSQHSASWSPLQTNNSRLAAWQPSDRSYKPLPSKHNGLANMTRPGVWACKDCFKTPTRPALIHPAQPQWRDSFILLRSSVFCILDGTVISRRVSCAFSPGNNNFW